MEYRIERDSMGEMQVPADRYWGAQTQRSIENFKIGGQRQPKEIITAFAYLKEACARANADVGKLTEQQAGAIAAACAEIVYDILKHKVLFITNYFSPRAYRARRLSVNRLYLYRREFLKAHLLCRRHRVF